MKRTLIIIGCVLIAFAFLLFFIKNDGSKNTSKSYANSDTATITSQAQWDAGTKNNIDTSSGSLKINNRSLTVGSRVSLTTSNIATNLTVDPDAPLDGQRCTTLGTTEAQMGNNDVGENTGEGKYAQFDLGEVHAYIWESVGYYPANGKVFEYSVDGSNWTTYDYFVDAWCLGGDCPFGQDPLSISSQHCQPNDFAYGFTTTLVPKTFRYLKVSANPGSILGPLISEMAFYPVEGGASEINLIEGGENFWEWEDFNDTKTVPENTSVTYRYRSSANGSDWNAWHSDFADVESHSGDTRYRYLQVEATLANTDGASTPTIDSYDIGYHTEVKPTKPTVQSAVAQ